MRVEWQGGKMVEVPGSEQVMPAQLVLARDGLRQPGRERARGVRRRARRARQREGDGRGDGGYATSVDKVFAPGDMRRGQSLVVWAIREGRQAARAVDEFLMGSSELPR